MPENLCFDYIDLTGFVANDFHGFAFFNESVFRFCIVYFFIDLHPARGAQYRMSHSRLSHQ